MGLVDCGPLLSAGAVFLPPGQAGLRSLHTQPTASQERVVWPRGRVPLRECPKHRFLRVPENPLQAAYVGGTQCLGWCACGGLILPERKFHFDPRGPAQSKGHCVKPAGPPPH